MTPKYFISSEALKLVGSTCNRDFGCMDENCPKIDKGKLVCDKLEISNCNFRFGLTSPLPMCMCWVKKEINDKYCK